MINDAARRKLREARNEAGISLRELARRVGVSASQLSQIENGKSSPSVSTLYALVTELGISLDALFNESLTGTDHRSRDVEPVPHAHDVVLGPDDRAVLDIDSGVRWERLTPTATSDVDALLTTYYPGGTSSSSGKLMVHAGVEYAYLFEGELILRLGFDRYVIRAGCSLNFDSTTPHLYVNEGDVPARGVWFVVDRQGRNTQAPDTASTPRPRPRRFASTVEALDALHEHREPRDGDPRR